MSADMRAVDWLREQQAVQCHQSADYIEKLEAKNARLRDELERERIRLAACGVVALSNTPESAAKHRDMHPDYMSASCQDVMRAVDREMEHRAEVARLREESGELKTLLGMCQQYLPRRDEAPGFRGRIDKALATKEETK